jgi:hypothetical protein
MLPYDYVAPGRVNMANRSSGLLAIVGAAVIAAGCLLPYETYSGTAARVFDWNPPHSVLFYALEPLAVIVASAALGILLLCGQRPELTSGVLLGTGIQTALYFAGFVGFFGTSDQGVDSSMGAGAFVGMLGGLIIAAAGGLLLARRQSAPAAIARTGAPPGWYADPSDASMVRYWSGSAWTQHTNAAQPPVDDGNTW